MQFRGILPKFQNETKYLWNPVTNFTMRGIWQIDFFPGYRSMHHLRGCCDHRRSLDCCCCPSASTQDRDMSPNMVENFTGHRTTTQSYTNTLCTRLLYVIVKISLEPQTSANWCSWNDWKTRSALLRMSCCTMYFWNRQCCVLLCWGSQTAQGSKTQQDARCW